MPLSAPFDGFDSTVVRSHEDFERSAYAGRASDFSFLDTDERCVLTMARDFGPVRVTYTESTGHRIVQRGEGRLGASAILTGSLYANANGGLQHVAAGRGLVHRSSAGRSQVGLAGTSVLVVSWPEPVTVPTDDAAPDRNMALGRGNRIYRDVLSFWETIVAAEREGRAERAAVLWAARMSEHVRSLLTAEGNGKRTTGALRHVLQAEDMMRAGLSSPLTIGEIAAAIGLTSRALQGAFVRHRSRTPHEQLSLMRLAAAYERLRRPMPDDTVLQVALDCGISHPGRFAAAYAQQFGERPSQTLRRGKIAA